jgi:YhcH/YjgK/YiaL family protein
MVIAKFDDRRRYRGLHPGFGDAFDALERAADFSVGRHELLEGRLALAVGKDEGRGRNSPLESHRRFIDIQYVLSGAEAMGWRHTEGLAQSAPYDAERDIVFYHDPPTVWASVPPGYFAIFFPEDAHAPLAGCGPIHKVVAKIAVDWRD